ncbi:MAG: hypothetical protein EOO94_04960, partial [Pedobacter sp.]
MRLYLFKVWFACVAVQSAGAQTKSLPVIDMHLHAMNVKGSSPARVGAPFDILGLHDPREAYPEAYQKALRTGAWSGRQFVATTNSDSLRL